MSVKKFKKYEDGDLKHLQADLLTIRAKLDELCKKHDIKYFAVGGTLLGAVRHEGYIPWDDDIDLGMLYEDYIKFINIPEEEYEGFGLYAPEKNPGEYYSFVTKFYYKDSRFLSPIAKEDGRNDMGLFVEIFPFYNMPSDGKKIGFIARRIEMIKALYVVSTCDKVIVFEEGLKGKILYLQKAVVKGITKIFGLSAAKLAKWYDGILSKYEGKDATYVVAASDTFKVYKKKWFESAEEVKFDDTTMPIPNGTVEYLIHYYGNDYMQLPPESGRWNQAAEYIRFLDGAEMGENPE